VLALAIGCKGCDDGADSPAATVEAEPELSGKDHLKARLATLNIDLTKDYPKRADGVVDCAEDLTCFVVMAERCEPALLDHRETASTPFLTKKVHARYRIEGPRGDSCSMQRLVIEAKAELPESSRKALLEKGRAQLEIDLMHGEAQALLQSSMPPRVTCLFTMGRTLDLALDMIEHKSFDAHFQEPCDVVGEEDDWPADLMPPEPEAEPEPEAKPELEPPAK
jgi:hypothetical protein